MTDAPDQEAAHRLEGQWYRLKCLEPTIEEVTMLIRYLIIWREESRKRRLPFE